MKLIWHLILACERLRQLRERFLAIADLALFKLSILLLVVVLESVDRVVLLQLLKRLGRVVVWRGYHAWIFICGLED